MVTASSFPRRNTQTGVFMRHLPIALFCAAVALLCSAAQSQSIIKPATTSAPVAYVYVSTAKGIYLYDAASTGKVTLAGGPYAVSGLPIGSNGKYFISIGTDYVHTYATASNGSIGKQVAQINTQLYAGSECGTTAGGTLDHTGKNVYVQLAGAIGSDGNLVCDAFQGFNISSSGQLTFTGPGIYDDNRFAYHGTPLAITANGLFAYNTTPIGQSCDEQFDGFQRESSGALNAIYPNFSGPTARPGGWGYYPNGPMAGDPSNHIAVYVIPEIDGPCGTIGTPQIASYSVDSKGNLSSTNTWLNMPAPNPNVQVMNMSPSGKLLAVGGSGLQVYHFNGATPITPYSGTLTSSPISWIHWDNANHLYALSSTKLYIFTVTPTSISPVTGSPYSISNANGLFVVPK
jgi:hypothetical protein